MSLIVANRVKEYSLSSGSGNVSLAGAVAGYQSFSGVMSSGDTTYYTIVNGSSWEVGVGTYLSSSLSRDEILSSNTGSKLNLTGQSLVFICYPSEKSVYRNLSDQIVVTSSGLRFNDGTIQTTATAGGSYTAGTGLLLTGTVFSIDGTVIQSGDNVSLLANDAGYLTSHPAISAASSSNNSGRTYIQDVLLDSNGHVTGVATATETVVDTDTTYSAGSGLALTGTVFSTSGTGVFSNIILSTGIPASTTNALYNNGGTLYFNGSGFGAGGTTYSAGSGLNLVGTVFSTSGTGVFSNIILSTGIPASTTNALYNNSGTLYFNGAVAGSGGTQYTAGSGLKLTGTVFSTSGTGVFTNIILSTGIPASTTNALYNNSGVLYFNGSGVDAGGGTTYSAGSGLKLTGTVFSTSGTGVFTNIILSTGVPASTTNALYNNSGTLYFNGSGIPYLNSSGYLNRSLHEPGSDSNPLRTSTTSPITMTTSYQNIGSALTVPSTGLWAMTWMHNGKGTANVIYDSRVLVSSGAISGAESDPIGFSHTSDGAGNLVSKGMLLSFLSSSGLILGHTGTSTQANTTKVEALLLFVTTGNAQLSAVVNSTNGTPQIIKSFLEMKKLS